jgi:ABC-2 type transport system ATP-binding protein
MATLLDVRGLSRHFGPITAVDNVSFAVERGGVLGFLGPNGAGKTTTMRMIAGFLAPSSGRPSSAAPTSAPIRWR